MKRMTFLVYVLSLLLAGSSMAFAHKIRIFAYSEADIIHGETGFSGGKHPKNVEIRVTTAADNTLLLTTSTDEEGKFSFPVPDSAKKDELDLRIVVDGGDGHRNSWLLEAADYLPAAQSASAKTPPPVSSPQPATGSHQESGTCESLDTEQLRSIIDESVARQLGPVQHMLAKSSERKVSLQDVLGGIGYIIGLAGLAAYIKARKGETA